MKALLVIFTICIHDILCQGVKVSGKVYPKKFASGKILINLPKYEKAKSLPPPVPPSVARSYTVFDGLGSNAVIQTGIPDSPYFPIDPGHQQESSLRKELSGNLQSLLRNKRSPDIPIVPPAEKDEKKIEPKEAEVQKETTQVPTAAAPAVTPAVTPATVTSATVATTTVTPTAVNPTSSPKEAKNESKGTARIPTSKENEIGRSGTNTPNRKVTAPANKGQPKSKAATALAHKGNPKSKAAVPAVHKGQLKSKAALPPVRKGKLKSKAASPRARTGKLKLKAAVPPKRKRQLKSKPVAPPVRKGQLKAKAAPPPVRKGKLKAKAAAPRGRKLKPKSKAAAPRGRKLKLKSKAALPRGRKLKLKAKAAAPPAHKKHILKGKTTSALDDKSKKKLQRSKNQKSKPLKETRRLIGAREALIEDYPYVVSIQKDEQHWCSGALLSPRMVITTANCLWKANRISRMQVRAGSRHTNHGGQLANIQEVMKHPNWSLRKGPDNDVALLLLDRFIKFSDEVHGVDLPNRVMLPPFDDAWITSWGSERRDGVYDHHDTTTLQVYHARLLDSEECNNVTTRFSIVVSENFICLAQTGKLAPCTRDTGAPAVSDGVLWGLASWGIRKRCGIERYPAMFSYLASHSNMDFIMNATHNLMSDKRQWPFHDRYSET